MNLANIIAIWTDEKYIYLVFQGKKFLKKYDGIYGGWKAKIVRIKRRIK